MNYVLTHDRWFQEYVLAYTNASNIIEEGFQDTEDLAGLFSGFEQQGKPYDARKGHWGYEQSADDSAASQAGSRNPHGRHGHGTNGSGEP